jgi:hypothetical protein
VFKEIKQKINCPNNVEMMEQEHALFDEIDMLDWIKHIWKSEVAVSTHNIYYLLLDSFTISMTAKVHTAFK